MTPRHERPTPRTNAAAREGAYVKEGKYPETCGKQIVHIDFARTLEQELAEAQEINKEQAAHIVALREAIGTCTFKDWFESEKTGEVVGSLDAVKVRKALSTPPPPVVPLKEVRMLVEALERILPEWHKEDNGTYANGQIAGEISVGDMRVAKKALAAFTAKHPL